MVKFSLEKVSKKGNQDLGEWNVPDSTTVDELTEQIAAKVGMHKYRQGLKYEEPGADGKVATTRLSGRTKALSAYDLEGKTLLLKDMGPQFSYRGVFLIEYGGPLAIMAAYTLRPAALFSGDASAPWSDVATLGFWCWMAHFAKRELETLFVHRFSRPTMPLGNLFKNSIYYWTFAAIVGLVLAAPGYTPTANPLQVQVGLAIFVISELLNGAVHVQLRNMRPAEGSDKREPPKGGLFALCSCPNYFFEVMSWVGFSVLTNIPFAWAFTLVGFLQMWQWAGAKHRGYVRQDPKLKARAAIIPFLL